MAKEIIRTDNAPAPLGGAPYNQAVKAGGLVFLAGQIPLDAESGQLVEGGIVEQTHTCFDNVAAILEAAGSDLTKVIRAQVYMIDLGEFGEMNGVYSERMGQPYPARSTFQVANLPAGARVEVEVVAEA
ncbi:MAG: Rid family detoxifying hydrolase [Actinomycetota bacterium]